MSLIFIFIFLALILLKKYIRKDFPSFSLLAPLSYLWNILQALKRAELFGITGVTYSFTQVNCSS